jgi:hypothetical protein
MNGWDTHGHQGSVDDGTVKKLYEELSTALGRFATDLGDRLDKVTVVIMTEFGRRIDENASGGTDHGHGACVLALGGKLNGGTVHGNWQGLAPGVRDQGDVPGSNDYRNVLGDVVTGRLGLTGAAGGRHACTSVDVSGGWSRRAVAADPVEEALGAGVAGVVEQLVGRAVLQDAAAVEEADPVGDLAGEAHLVGGDQHGHAALLQLGDHVEHLPHQLGVEGRGDLVEQHQLGPHRQGAHDRHPLLLTAAELVGVGVALVGQPEPRQQLVGPLDGLRLPDP